MVRNAAVHSLLLQRRIERVEHAAERDRPLLPDLPAKRGPVLQRPPAWMDLACYALAGAARRRHRVFLKIPGRNSRRRQAFARSDGVDQKDISHGRHLASRHHHAVVLMVAVSWFDVPWARRRAGTFKHRRRRMAGRLDVLAGSDSRRPPVLRGVRRHARARPVGQSECNLPLPALPRPVEQGVSVQSRSDRAARLAWRSARSRAEAARIEHQPLSLSDHQRRTEYRGFAIRQQARPQRRFLHVHAGIYRQRRHRLRWHRADRKRRNGPRSRHGNGDLGRGDLLEHGERDDQAAEPDAGAAQHQARLLAAQPAHCPQGPPLVATRIRRARFSAVQGDVQLDHRDQPHGLSDRRRQHRKSRRLRTHEAALSVHHRGRCGGGPDPELSFVPAARAIRAHRSRRHRRSALAGHSRADAFGRQGARAAK